MRTLGLLKVTSFLNKMKLLIVSVLEQIMTSYPGERLLSPLAEDLIHLTEKMKPKGKSETKPLHKTSLECSGILVNGSLSSRSNQKVMEPKKLKSCEKVDALSFELTHQKNNYDMDNAVSLSKKEQETDIDASGCEELVSTTLKLPLLSSSQHTVADPEKDMSTIPLNVPRDGLKVASFSAYVGKEHLDSESAQDIGGYDKLDGNLGSSGKVSESIRGNILSKNAACPQADIPKAEKPHPSNQSESNVTKGRKAVNAAEPSDSSKQVVIQKGESVSEKSSSESKRKQKSSQSKGTQGTYMAKDKLMVESSLNPKIGKSSIDHEKTGDRYKDFFGDVKFDEDDDESISGETKSSGRLKSTQLVGKRSLNEDHNISKEKLNGDNAEKRTRPEKYPRPASHLAHPLPNRPSSEAPTGMIPLVNEDWVSCDKCQKWRLLPLGTNPKSLPDKWLCRMLTWL